MKLSTRLILLLSIAVSIVMLAASIVTLRQREAALLNAARDEARAHAITLRIAIEEDYRSDRTLEAQRLINRLRENTGLVSVVLFDAKGDIAAISKTLPVQQFEDSDEARQVIATGKSMEMERRSLGRDHLSIIEPLQVQGATIGAIEIILEITVIRSDIARARIHVVLTYLLLLGTVLLVVIVVTRYSLTRPIDELLEGAAAVGRGDLSYRVPVKPMFCELASLAQQYNRTADSLAEQRAALVHESEERVQLERRLRHNEQLALAGKLAAGVAHEIGAPLQVIDGRAKNLLQNTEATVETRQRNLTIISSQVERINRIVRQLLDLSRPYNVQTRPTSLRQLMQETIELLEVMAENAGVAIQYQANSDVMLNIDPELIQQLLLNICRNGIQAIPNGGKLMIDWRAGAAAKEGRKFAALLIQDTGVGIAQEHLPVLFDLFFTTKEVGQGTGLGLPVSRHIVEEHGGWIEADNRVQGGAVFTVYLPEAENENSGFVSENAEEPSA